MADILFSKWKYRSGSVDFLMGETMPEENIDFVLRDPLDASYPLDFVFGLEGEVALPLILGNSTSVISITSVGTGEGEFDGVSGTSSITVDVTSAGTASILVTGFGSVNVDISSVGTGLNFIDREGNSSITVDVTSIGAAIKDIWGNSSQTIGVVSIGDGSVVGGLPIEGNSNITVDVTSYGEVWKSIWGDSNTTVNVTSNGFAVYNLEANSNINVEVNSTGFGFRDKEGNSNITVEVTTSGVANKEVWGNGFGVISITTTGNAVLTGGFPIDANQSYTVGVSSTGTGRILLPIFGMSGKPVEVNTSGSGEVRFIYQDILGESNVTIEIGAPGAARMPNPVAPVYTIPKIDIDYSEIKFKTNVFVDQDTGVFEVRDIITNRKFLEDIYLEKQTEHLVVGSKRRETIYNEDKGTTGIEVARRLDIRRFGPSMVSLEINITTDYRFFKNQVSIEEAIKRLIDRGVKDTVSLYEVEYD